MKEGNVLFYQLPSNNDEFVNINAYINNKKGEFTKLSDFLDFCYSMEE